MVWWPGGYRGTCIVRHSDNVLPEERTRQTLHIEEIVQLTPPQSSLAVFANPPQFSHLTTPLILALDGHQYQCIV